MHYETADDLKKIAEEIVTKLKLNHILLDDVCFIRIYGSKSKRTIARCHGLSKVMQKALGRKGFYVLEFLSERFDKLSHEDKIKTIIHELMHIPKSFGGGFKHHNYVTEKNVERMFNQLKELDNNEKYKHKAIW